MDQNTAKKLLYSIGLLYLAYLLFQHVLPILLPFVLALGLALILSKPINHISQRIHVKKSLLSGILTTGVLLLAGCILWFFICQLIQQIRNLIASDTLETLYPELLYTCSCTIADLFHLDKQSVYTTLSCKISDFAGSFKTDFISHAFTGSISSVKWICEGITFLVVTITASLFFFKDLESVKMNFQKLPFFPFLSHYYHTTLRLSSVYLRAQLIILTVTIAITTIGLFLIKQPYSLLIGTAIGLLDALPFIGSGLALLPMALFKLLAGDFLHSAILLTIYILNSGARDVLEPKLIGKRLRLPSIYILIAIYIGFCLFGVKGILFGPLYFLFSYQLMKWFWKSRSHLSS